MNLYNCSILLVDDNEKLAGITCDIFKKERLRDRLYGGEL